MFVTRRVISVGSCHRSVEVSRAITQSVFIWIVISHWQCQLSVLTGLVVHDVIQRLGSRVVHREVHVVQLVWGCCQTQRGRLLGTQITHTYFDGIFEQDTALVEFRCGVRDWSAQWRHIALSNLLRSRNFSNYSLLIDQCLKWVFLRLIQTFIEILNQTLIAQQCLLILSQLELQPINQLFLRITLFL